jgi:hypothetical protein
MEALGFEPRGGAGPDGPPPWLADSRTGPAIRIVPGLRPPPALAVPARIPRGWRALLAVPEPRITARGEWALAAFTATLAVLAALMAAAAAGTGRVLPRPLPYPWLVLWAGPVSISLGAWHLGRPDRGWRALGNLRRSWLSREAALVLVFLGLAALSLAGFPRERALAWAAAAAGFAALFAADRVCQVVTRTGPLNLHSAQCLLNGLYLAGLLAGYGPLALGAGLLKAALYLQRKAHFRRRGRGARPLLSLARVVLGFAVPALVFGTGLAVLGAILGDLADRWEYYGELELPAPGLGLVREVAAMTRSRISGINGS